MTRVINPYTFVPFGVGVQREPVNAGPGAAPLHSGYLDVKLIVRTPLIIPDGARYDVEMLPPDRNGRVMPHKTFQFYTLPNGEKAIPGSSLRGMIRSVYEAASNSCVPFVRSGNPISIRSPIYGAFQKRGLLEYEPQSQSWVLYEAHVYRKRVQPSELIGGTYQGFKCAQHVDFTARGFDLLQLRPHSPKASDGADWMEGWLQFHQPIVPNRPYHVCVLSKKGEINRWRGSDDPYRLLRNALFETERNSAIKTIETHIALRAALDEAKKYGGVVPLWYLQLGNSELSKAYHFSPSAIGRVAQRNSWREVMGEHAPCDGREGCYCPACRLFGTIEGGGFRGRLRFSDARLEGDAELRRHTLPILAGPKEQAYEFYLRRPAPEATFWNYDYYGSRTVDGILYINQRPMPRGRKMYWHSRPAPDVEKNKMNSTMEAMEPGAEFRFRVYFDRLTETQLNDLIWTITLGENRAESPLQHKLGHARPLGYGSVKLLVERCVERTLSAASGKLTYALRERPCEVAKCSFMGEEPNSPVFRALLAVCNANSAQRPNQAVAYPAIRGKIYSWFARNHTNPARLQTLPEPYDGDISVHLFDEAEEGQPQPRAERFSTGFTANARAEALNWSELLGRYGRGARVHGKFKALQGNTATVALREIDCDAQLSVRPNDAAYLKKLKSGAEMEFLIERIDPFGKQILLKPGGR